MRSAALTDRHCPCRILNFWHWHRAALPRGPNTACRSSQPALSAGTTEIASAAVLRVLAAIADAPYQEGRASPNDSIVALLTTSCQERSAPRPATVGRAPISPAPNRRTDRWTRRGGAKAQAG